MRVIEGKMHYQSSEVALIIGKSTQTVVNWDKYSDILEKRGEKRLIPRPIRTASNWRFWGEDDIEKIVNFSRNIKHGDMVEYNRKLQKR